MDDAAPRAGYSLNQLKARCALALCRGASLWLASASGHSGRYGEDLELVKAVGEWARDLKPYLNNAQPVAAVAIVLSGADCDLPASNTFWEQYPYQQQRPTGPFGLFR